VTTSLNDFLASACRVPKSASSSTFAKQRGANAKKETKTLIAIVPQENIRPLFIRLQLWLTTIRQRTVML
jgi:hypothetical protein